MAADGNARGSIGFSTTYRPPLPLDIFSCPIPTKGGELSMTDGESYNYNGHFIPSTALKTIHQKLASKGLLTDSSFDVDSGQLLGIVFVSERDNLETLHIALGFRGNTTSTVVVSLAQVFGTTEFHGVRMEDSGCFSSDYIFYVTTKDPAPSRRQPWTAVYKTHLITGQTQRLTPPGQADLNPSVSPSGKMIAVASFEAKKDGWDGEIEDLRTNIFVMNVEKPYDRKLVVKNGGWPTWGSDNIIFFHRKVGMCWGVFRANIRKGFPPDIARVTPEGIDAMTPAAINSTTVAVATIREKSQFDDARVAAQYRHVEIFHSSGLNPSIRITQKNRPKADHFNPFVIDDKDGKRIGYHRCRSEDLKSGDHNPIQFNKLHSPDPEVGLFRLPVMFPAFSSDGSKLAFVDNEFKALWVADDKGLRVLYSTKVNNLFSPVWNKNLSKDTLYVCVGPAFNAKESLQISAFVNVSKGRQQRKNLTMKANNAFPSSNPDGTKLVFRSTRDYPEHGHKNLYIMEDASIGEFGGKITRLTTGEWTDTQCQWSPSGDWIVFSSNRGKPNKDSPADDNGLDSGYFAVFLVNCRDSEVLVRVVANGDNIAGHVNHPFFSPDGKSIVVAADLAAVSVDPVSLPLCVHSVRPYGDIFTVDIIDPKDIEKNEDVKNFTRITHSRYENSTASWTMFSTQNPTAKWNLQPNLNSGYTPTCPYAYPDGGESWHMTGHLCIPKRAC